MGWFRRDSKVEIETEETIELRNKVIELENELNDSKNTILCLNQQIDANKELQEAQKLYEEFMSNKDQQITQLEEDALMMSRKHTQQNQKIVELEDKIKRFQKANDLQKIIYDNTEVVRNNTKSTNDLNVEFKELQNEVKRMSKTINENENIFEAIMDYLKEHRTHKADKFQGRKGNSHLSEESKKCAVLITKLEPSIPHKSIALLFGIHYTSMSVYIKQYQQEFAHYDQQLVLQ